MDIISLSYFGFIGRTLSPKVVKMWTTLHNAVEKVQEKGSFTRKKKYKSLLLLRRGKQQEVKAPTRRLILDRGELQ